MPSKVETARAVLGQGRLVVMPCCFDALSARLIATAGFPVTFMSGFAVSATRLGLPDTGQISYGEMVDQGRSICDAVPIPVFGDGDTGYGGAVNVKRTVAGYARAGFAGVMIEDQVWPKRCGHTRGKAVVDRDEALRRVRAAVDARDEGAGCLIIARTDARHTHGLAEAIARACAFADLGADILFVEAPQSEAELARIAREVPGWKMANLVEGGATPLLAPDRLQDLGFALAAYPLTLLSAAVRAMQEALADLAALGSARPDRLLTFEALRAVVGFEQFYQEEERYRAPPPPKTGA